MAFHDPTEHIQTRETFDAEVNALAARALRSGSNPPLIETPIITVEQITNELLDLIASGSPARHDGTRAFVVEAWVQRRRAAQRPRRSVRSRRAAEPTLDGSELEYRREGLRVTLSKLVAGGMDVAPVVNVVDAARWQYAAQFAGRSQKRMAAKLKRLKANADRALRDLIRYHYAADREVRKLRGPGTLDEDMAGITERLYPEAEPGLTYMAAHDLLSRDGRLNPPFLSNRRPSTRTPLHQELIARVKDDLRRLGVGADDASDLIRYMGLLTLMRLDRL